MKTDMMELHRKYMNEKREVKYYHVANMTFKVLWTVYDVRDFHAVADGFETEAEAIDYMMANNNWRIYPYQVKVN